MRLLLAALAVVLLPTIAIANVLSRDVATTVTASFCRSETVTMQILESYESEGYTASLPVWAVHLRSGECKTIRAEVIPREVIHETADGKARIIKVESPTKPGEFIYMLTMRYSLK